MLNIDRSPSPSHLNTPNSLSPSTSPVSTPVRSLSPSPDFFDKPSISSTGIHFKCPSAERVKFIVINLSLISATGGAAGSIYWTHKLGWTVPVTVTTVGALIQCLLSYNLSTPTRRTQHYITTLLLYPFYWVTWQPYSRNPTELWRQIGVLSSSTVYTGTVLKEYLESFKRLYQAWNNPRTNYSSNLSQKTPTQETQEAQEPPPTAKSFREFLMTRENLIYAAKQGCFIASGSGLFTGGFFVPCPWDTAMEIPGLLLMCSGAAALARRGLRSYTLYSAHNTLVNWRKNPTDHSPLHSTTTKVSSFVSEAIHNILAPLAAAIFLVGVITKITSLTAITGALNGWKRHQDELLWERRTLARHRISEDAPIQVATKWVERVVLGAFSLGIPAYTAWETWKNQSKITYIVTGVIVGTFYPAYIATVLLQRAVKREGIREGLRGEILSFLHRTFNDSPDLLGYVWVYLFFESKHLFSPYSLIDLMLAWGAMLTLLGLSIGNISYLPPQDPEDENLFSISTSAIAHIANLLTLIIILPTIFAPQLPSTTEPLCYAPIR